MATAPASIIFCVMNSHSDTHPDTHLPIGSELPPGRRGPHALVTLGGFAALVAAALVVISGLVSLARLLDRTL